MKAIRGGRVFHGGAFHEDMVILYDGDVQAVLPRADFLESSAESVLELEGQYVLPGFIDLHIHGYAGSDAMDATPEALRKISEGIVKNGVTSFLPTTMSMAKGDIERALENISVCMKLEDWSGAGVLGAHMEGPFINPEKKGAQAAENIISVDSSFIENHLEVIKVVTLAPEVDGALSLIENFKDQIRFSIGHTSADFNATKAGLEAGAKSVTHLFNAMTPLSHRAPGVVGAALTSDCYVELICDNYHIDSSLYQIVLDSKGNERILLITDCIRAGGLKDGKYDLGGQEVTVQGVKCTLADGTIAGSMLRFSEALKNFYDGTDASLEALIPMTSKNQAEYLGINDRLGDIAEGKRADFAVLNEQFEVEYTIVKGEIEFESR